MGKARDLARLNVNSSGAIDASNLGNAVPADGSITSAKIADGSIATADIANGAVTIAKLSASGTPGSGNFLRGDGSWQAPPSAVADGSVTDIKIADGMSSGTTWYPLTMGGNTSNSSSGGTWRNVFQFRCYRGGTFQLRSRVFNSIDFSAGVAIRALVNGSVVATSSTVYPGAYANSGILTLGSFSVARGQVLQLQAYHDSSNSSSLIQFVQIGLNGATYSTPSFTMEAINGDGQTSSGSYAPI